MRILLPLLVLFYAVAASTAAQWYVGLELATPRYHGSSHDTSSGGLNPDGRPGNATMVSLRFSHGWKRWSTGIRLSYAKTGFSVANNDLDVTIRTTGRLFEVAGLVNTRVGGIGSSGAMRVEVGPALHLWDFDDEFRARLGAVGAASYEWPIGGRFSGAARLEGVVSKSWFNAADLPSELERRRTWRYGVSLGLRYRLT